MARKNMFYDLPGGQRSKVQLRRTHGRRCVGGPAGGVGLLEVSLKPDGSRVVFPGELGWLPVQRRANMFYLAADTSRSDVDMSLYGHHSVPVEAAGARSQGDGVGEGIPLVVHRAGVPVQLRRRFRRTTSGRSTR